MPFDSISFAVMERPRGFYTGAKIGRKRHEPDYDADKEDTAVRSRKRCCRPPLIQFHTHRSSRSRSSSVESVTSLLAALTGDHDVNSAIQSSRLSYTAPLPPAVHLQMPASPAEAITNVTSKEAASPGLPPPLELGDFVLFKEYVPLFHGGMPLVWSGDHDINSAIKSSRLSYIAPLPPADHLQIPASPAATIANATFKEAASPGLPLPLESGEFVPFKNDVPLFDDGTPPVWFEDSDLIFLDNWPLSPLAYLIN